MPSRQFLIQQAILNAVHFRCETVREFPHLAANYLRFYSGRGTSVGEVFREEVIKEFRLLEAKYL